MSTIGCFCAVLISGWQSSTSKVDVDGDPLVDFGSADSGIRCMHYFVSFPSNIARFTENDVRSEEYLLQESPPERLG